MRKLLKTMKQITLKNKAKTKSLYIVYDVDACWGIAPAGILRKYTRELSDFSISNEDFDELIKEITRYATERLYGYLARRERTISESQMYLRRLFFHDYIIEDVIASAIEINYINEARYAQCFVENAFYQHKGEQYIRYTLSQKQVSATDISNALTEYYDENDVDEIIEAAFKKALIRYPEDTGQRKKNKLLGYLTRRGFSYEDILPLIDKYL